MKKAVRGMLPKNRLRDKRLARLKVFETSNHPYKQNIVSFGGVPHMPGKEGTVIQAIQATRRLEQPEAEQTL